MSQPPFRIISYMWKHYMTTKEAFVRHLIARKGLQPVTVKGYVGSMVRIIREIGERPTRVDTEHFVESLYLSKYSYHHKLNTVLALEQYLAFIGRPTRFGRQKKPRPIVKDTLTEGEVTRLLVMTKDIRQKAIVSLLAYSGIRNLELCNLRVRDCLLTKNTLRILCGKGLRDGLSEITPECSEVLLEYLTQFPRKPNDFLFSTLCRGNQLATGDVRKMVRVLAARAGMVKRVYPHLFRHSMTANMLLRGADIVSLRAQLRHTLLETTLHYANSILFVERNRYQKFAPSYL